MNTFSLANSLATLSLPEWAQPWVAIGGLIAWVVGARALGMVAAILLLAPFLAPWLTTLPDWVLWLSGGVMLLLVLHSVIYLLFGKETAGHVSGSYLIRLFDFLLLGPFRLLRRLL